MALLSALLDRIHDEFPSVPEALALRALSDAVKEFCVRTHIWQADLRVSLREGTTTYTLYPDTGMQIVALKDVRLDGTKIHPVATDGVRLRRDTPAAAAPSSFIQLTPDTIEMVAAPVDAARLNVKAAVTLALGETSIEIPDSLADEYGEDLAMGAKMRLVRQAGQPWYAPETTGYSVAFYRAITAAKGRAMSGLGEAEMQIQMRSW